MRRRATSLITTIAVLVGACGGTAGDTTTTAIAAGSTTTTRPAATTTTSPATVATTSPTTAPAVETGWEPTGLWDVADRDIAMVSDLLVTSDGLVVAAFHGSAGAFTATASPADLTWSLDEIPGADQIRDLIELPDGGLLVTGSADPGQPILWRNDGDGWMPLARDSFPRADATIGWDLVVLDDGSILLATDASRNDPDAINPGVHRSTDGGATWTTVGEFPGLGVLALVELRDGTVLAATEQSTEHDDPTTAGQANVYRSADGGSTWEGPVPLPGANRVYTLVEMSDGTVWAGTGISARILSSRDGGRTWTQLGEVPAATRIVGEGGTTEVVDVTATRVYSILELEDGRVLIGTGNQTGDVYVSSDRGRTWEPTPETGLNNVVWALLQTDDGTIWIGTGSAQGDLVVGRL